MFLLNRKNVFVFYSKYAIFVNSKILLKSAIIWQYSVDLPFCFRGKNEAFRLAVLLCFMCPPGFPVPLQVQPLAGNEEDESFLSAFIPLSLIVPLIAYVILAAMF